MFDPTELCLLKKLDGGGEILYEERETAYRLAALGVLRLGYNDEDEQFCETGHLSEFGRRVIRRERIRRNPILRVLNAVFQPLFGSN